MIQGGWVFIMSEVPLYNGEVDSPECSLALCSLSLPLSLSRFLSLHPSLSLSLAFSLSLSFPLSLSLSLFSSLSLSFPLSLSLALSP